MIETKLDGKSKNIVKDNISKLKELFPEIMEEDKINFDKLKMLLIDDINDDDNIFGFTWPGRMEATDESQTRSTGTLRPCKEESKNWDTTENLYIEGDNLEVLKLLQKTYYGKIKAIYIDPPYNTGNDLIYQNNYHDNLEYYLELIGQAEKDEDGKTVKLTTNTDSNGRYHSAWLTMMFSRLKLARNLLTEDGCIVIAIDHYELNHLINICNDIFGEENRLGIVTVVHKPEGRQHAKFFSASNEFMLVYARDKHFAKFNQVVLSDEKLKEFTEKDDIGNFKWKNFIRGDTTRKQKVKGFYPIYVSPDLKDLTLEEKEGYSAAWPIDKKGTERAWIVLPEGFTERLNKGEMKAERNPTTGDIEIFYKIREQQILVTHWIDKKYNATANGTNILKKLMGGKTFDFPKSLYLVEDILKIIAGKDSIVLDFFSGSGTTAHAVMDMNQKEDKNQKFIMVQLPYPCEEDSDAFKAGYKNLCEIGKERIRRAGDSIVEETGDSDLDIGFKVFKLDSSNLEKWDPDYENIEQSVLKSVDNIKDGRSKEDLIYEIMIKYGIDLTLPIEEHKIGNNTLYSIGLGALIICLDNHITKDIADPIHELTKNARYCRVVFRDNGFVLDEDKTNLKKTLKTKGINEFVTI